VCIILAIVPSLFISFGLLFTECEVPRQNGERLAQQSQDSSPPGRQKQLVRCREGEAAETGAAPRPSTMFCFILYAG
jgi:hypothetical protein